MSAETAPAVAAERRLFGTDGMRAPFGRHPLDEATVRTLGRELGRRLRAGTAAPRVVLGGDPRDSTPVLCGWLAAGLEAGGAEITYLGTVPTPAVAATARALGAACGVAVSASHNLHPDNGIKVIGGDGFKWPVAAEAELEAALFAAPPPPPHEPPELTVDREAVDRYLAALAASLPDERPLGGLGIVLDAANGAAAPYAGDLFGRLGARVTVLHDRPDGRNINRESGSTHPEGLARAVVAEGADLGFAFDGDADRAILVDEHGEVRDGDAMLYLWARDLDSRGELAGRRLVVTSMSNLGLETALAREGIGLERCDVGDRAVVETLRGAGLILGGEPSGHLVHLGLSTTGDGLLTALQLAALRRRADRPIAELLAGLERFPQLLHNLPVRSKPPLAEMPAIAAAVRRIEERLAGDGRLVLRYSGTEPKVRIMLEGRDAALIEDLAADLAAVLTAELG